VLPGVSHTHLQGAVPGNPRRFTSYSGGLDEAGCLAALHAAIVADVDPAEVVLLETPDQQKTRVDFACTEAMLGVRRSACPTSAAAATGSIPARWPRDTRSAASTTAVIFDELLRKKPEMRSRSRRPRRAVGRHPNWYFPRQPKQPSPFLRGPIRAARAVSSATSHADLPAELGNYVLKPLYSFAGLGVDIAPTRENRRRPAPRRMAPATQVTYAPILATPDGPAQGRGPPDSRRRRHGLAAASMNHLCPLTKGAMHGVDFNKGRTWVGSSAAFMRALIWGA